jgi:pimeloyl-ACP methyl ester carboxylesterase
MASESVQKIGPEQAAVQFLTPRRRPPSDPPHPAGARELRIASAGEELAAWAWGERPNVFLVHGWEADHADMLGFVEPLIAAGLTPLAIDLPAHGRSTGMLASIPHMAKALADAAAALGPFDAIIAHSIGCAVTTCALWEGMTAARAVMLASPVRYRWYARHAARAMGLTEDDWPDMREALLKAGVRIDEIDSTLMAPSLKQAALFFHSADDKVVPISHGRETASHWPGAEFRQVEGLGHTRLLRDEAVIAASVRFAAGAADPMESDRWL